MSLSRIMTVSIIREQIIMMNASYLVSPTSKGPHAQGPRPAGFGIRVHGRMITPTLISQDETRKFRWYRLAPNSKF